MISSKVIFEGGTKVACRTHVFGVSPAFSIPLLFLLSVEPWLPLESSPISLACHHAWAGLHGQRPPSHQVLGLCLDETPGGLTQCLPLKGAIGGFAALPQNSPGEMGTLLVGREHRPHNRHSKQPLDLAGWAVMTQEERETESHLGAQLRLTLQ